MLFKYAYFFCLQLIMQTFCQEFYNQPACTKKMKFGVILQIIICKFAAGGLTNYLFIGNSESLPYQISVEPNLFNSMLI